MENSQLHAMGEPERVRICAGARVLAQPESTAVTLQSRHHGGCLKVEPNTRVTDSNNSTSRNALEQAQVRSGTNGMTDRKATMQKLMPVISLLLITVAMAIIHHEISSYGWQHIKDGLSAVPAGLFASMVGLAALGYLVLSSYDVLALEYATERLPYRLVLLASFLSYAISNTVGYPFISGGSLRYRLYSSAGVSWMSIAKVAVFCSATYLLAAVTILTVALPVLQAGPGLGDGFDHVPGVLIAWIGAALLLAWWGSVFFFRGTVSLKGFSLALPAPSLAAKQLVAGVTDLVAASLVLYLPVLQLTGMPFGPFLAIYVFAQLSGLASQVPGGLGVFEASFLYLAPNEYSSAGLLAALVAYRVVYYFLPLVAAGFILVLYEWRANRIVRQGKANGTLRAIEPFVPQVISVLLLIGGSVMLLSGATAGELDRLRWLHYFVPLPLIEFSHLAGSLAGVAMLFLSRAVWLRLDSAYYAALAMLGVGAVASLAKGWDFEEAAIMLLLMALIVPARKHFYRKSSLLTLDIPGHWAALIVIAIGLSIWLGFFSYRHTEYSNELWWQFTLQGDAPRFLRSLMAVSVLVIGFTAYRFLTRAAEAFKLPDAGALERAATIALHASETAPHLALMGDKYLLWSETGESFIMFGKSHGFWLAMGDPAGNPKEFELLARKFRDLADLHSARIAFYQVGDDHLPIYIDLGLALIKLGEEARVRLEAFSLEGHERQGLRHAHNKHEREGLRMEIVLARDVAEILPALRNISDHWLVDKKAKEKRFSLGYFDDDYLRRCDVAVVKQDGRIVAFANLWMTESLEELSMDLMRYEPGSPNGVMEFLIVELMLLGKARGHKWFNLGMAPLSGLEKHPLAPLWHKIGNTIFRLGNEFYNFEGLLQYKNKFDPVWRPRYLAAPAGLQGAQALVAATSLISKGLKGVVLK